MGLSENSVPLNPMVNDHYPYWMAIIGGIHHFQTNPYTVMTRLWFRDRLSLQTDPSPRESSCESSSAAGCFLFGLPGSHCTPGSLCHCDRGPSGKGWRGRAQSKPVKTQIFISEDSCFGQKASSELSQQLKLLVVSAVSNESSKADCYSCHDWSVQTKAGWQPQSI